MEIDTNTEYINISAKSLSKLPNLPKIIEEVKKFLEQETKDREQFYRDVNEGQKAEFINGKALFHSPVMRRHWAISVALSSILHEHIREHNLGELAVEKAMIHLSRNSYEPDICFWKKEIADTFTDKQMLFPAPSLVVEILSPSTEKNDRGIKKVDYAAHGVEEYWIIDPVKKSFEQYILYNTNFELHCKLQGSGIIKTHTLENFVLDIKTIL